MAAPYGARGDAHSRPRWPSTIDRQIESPIPRPSDFVVKKGSKRRSATVGSSPAPVSSTEISTLPGSARVDVTIGSRVRSATPLIASTIDPKRSVSRYTAGSLIERDRAQAPRVGVGPIRASLRCGGGPMAETRKLAAILCSDVVGYSRLAGADEDRILARLRALRSDLIDPTIAVHNGRVVKRTGDGSIVEFRSIVGAVRCAIEVQSAMVDRNAGVPEDRRIVFRIGIHLGDVVEENDIIGDGVNIAARLESICEPGGISISRSVYDQIDGKLALSFRNLGLQKAEEHH